VDVRLVNAEESMDRGPVARSGRLVRDVAIDRREPDVSETRQHKAGWRSWLSPWPDAGPLSTRQLAVRRTVWWLVMTSPCWLMLPIAFGDLRAFAFIIWMIPIGMQLIVLSRRRIGDESHCAACGYEVGPMENRPRRCPECGADWYGSGALVRGRRQNDRLILWIGIGLIVLTVPFVWNRVFLRGLEWRILPVGMLTPELRDPNGLVSDEAWTALTSRSLTPNESARIAEALLDRRLVDYMLDGREIAWLEANLPTLTTRADLTDRYYQEWLQLDLGVPKQVRTGTPFVVTAKPRPRFWSSNAIAVQAWVTHIFIGDSSEPVISPMVQLNASEIFPQDGQWFFRAPGSRSLEKMPPHKWTIPAVPSKTGPSKVRVEIIHIAGPRQFAYQPGLVRSGDQITVDPRATYVKTIELSVPIDVTE
jgi:hypothetical protein